MRALMLCLVAGCSNTTSQPPPPVAQVGKPAPVVRAEVEGPGFAVVELFTSEGCSSCPPADALLHDLGEATGVIPLAFHVDYWNGSWSDPFSSEKVTIRQRNYAVALGTGLFTPEMVVNGSAQFVGSNRASAKERIAAALQSAPRAKLIVTAKRDGKDKLTAQWSSEPALEGTTLLVALTERDLTMVPTAGELGGETLHHDHVVRAFALADGSKGTGTLALTHPADVRREQAHIVVLLQEKSQGPIVAATRIAAP